MCTLTADMLLYRSAGAHNLPIMCHALAIGADKNWKNPNDYGRTCLFQAVNSVSILYYIYLTHKRAFLNVFKIFSIIINLFTYQGSVMACEYLILNAVDINVQDNHGQTPIFFATLLGKCVFYQMLLKHKRFLNSTLICIQLVFSILTQ